MSVLGQKQTYAAHKVMSALHPKADMCGATSDVRFGPKADIQDGYDRSSRNAIAAMLNMRVRGRFTDSDLVN